MAKEAAGSAVLNAAQRDAVEHAPDAGPLIVLAGPGTGKTRVIIHRVAHLISAHGAAPESIVAVTFTIKAAEQLSRRLEALVGPAASRVRTMTFHGLGVSLLRRFGDRMDLPPLRIDDAAPGSRARTMRLADSAQLRRLLRRTIIAEDLFGYARAGGLDSIIEQATRLFEYFDNHALTPEDTRALSTRWGEALAEARTMNGAPLADLELAASRDRHAKFTDMARLHAMVDRERRAQGMMSFGDQMMLPIRLLREQPGVAAQCRAMYRHWLVDEFQDVNKAQIDLLKLLAPPSRRPDLCIVGDDDQSIYGFRGADDRAMQRFARGWSGGDGAGPRVVKLSDNYRSGRTIVEVSNTIIERAEERFAPDKKIIAVTENPGIVQHVVLREEKDDGEVIAAMIRLDLLARAQEPPVADADRAGLRRYAVVARSHNDLDRIEQSLLMEGMATIRSKRSSAAGDEGVQDALTWARLIVSPSDHWLARRLLLRPPIAAPLEQVNAWDQAFRAERSRRRELAQRSGRTEAAMSFADWLAATAADQAAAQRFVEWFAAFRRAAAEESAAALFTRIVRETGLTHADLADSWSRAQRVERVVTMLNFVQARQDRLPQPGGVREFLEYYDDLSEREQGFGDPTEADESPDEDGRHPDAVRLMTSHGAKGLEFHTVFVPRVRWSHGFPSRPKSGGEAIPPEVAGWADELGPKDDEARAMAEERRMFYVACTRAERRLVLLAKSAPKKSTGPSYMVELLSDQRVAPRIEVLASSDILLRAAKEAGRVYLPASEGLDLEGDVGVRDYKRELFERARREARLAAAGALARVDDPAAGAAPLMIERAGIELRAAAARLAAIAAIEVTGKVPESARDADAPTRRMLEMLAAEMQRVEKKPPAARLAPVRPPLELSFSSFYQYRRCSACYYAKEILKFEGPAGSPEKLGQAMHSALQGFYEQFREADASGLPSPTAEDLARMARDAYLRMLGADEEVNSANVDRLQAQARLMHARLHDSRTHVLEMERPFRFEYPRNGHVHRVTGRIDRIDSITLPDGRAGFRIVDYKSGMPLKELRMPPADDLQIGIYLLAMQQEYGEVAGEAEYWLLSTGERGRLRFEDVNMKKVRAAIDDTIDGILAGEFRRKKNCDGVCQVLGLDR